MSNNKIGFRRVDHVSITVADADATAEFYKRVFGAEERYRLGPLRSADMPPHTDGRDWTDAFLGVPEATVTIVMLGLGDNFGLELFQYDHPVSAVVSPPPSNIIGAHHIGLEIDDLDSAVAHLIENGCSMMAGPITMDSGPVAGSRFHYLLDPFGNILELVSHH